MNPDIQQAISALPDKPLLRVEEVVKFLQVTRWTIYRWYEGGKLKGCNVAGTLRIYRSGVVELLKNGDGKSKEEETHEEVEAKIKKTSKPIRKQTGGFVHRW